MKESSRSKADSAGQRGEDPRPESEESGKRKYWKCGLKVTARAPISSWPPGLAGHIAGWSGDDGSTGHSSPSLLSIVVYRTPAPPIRTIQLLQTLDHALAALPAFHNVQSLFQSRDLPGSR